MYVPSSGNLHLFLQLQLIGLVASGALPLPSAIAAILGANIGTTGTIWLAGIMVSDGMPQGITKQIAMIHTGVNALMASCFASFCSTHCKIYCQNSKLLNIMLGSGRFSFLHFNISWSEGLDANY